MMNVFLRYILLGLLIISCITVSPQQCRAQNAMNVGASIEVEGKNPDYDTVDYGYILVRASTKLYTKNVRVVNTGDSVIQIPLGERPYYQLLTQPQFSNEFITATNTFPFRVTSSERAKEFQLPFLPSNIAVQSPAGLREAKAIFSVRSNDDTSKLVLLDTIILRAVKSFTPLWSDFAFVNFDSVYINPILPKRQQWTLRNLDSANLAVQVDTISSVVLPRSNAVLRFANQTVTTLLQPDAVNPYIYNFEYQPQQAGRDTKSYTFKYQNALTNSNDSIQVTLQGVGVEQKIQAVNALPTRVKVKTNGDTIDIGNVRVNTTDTIRIVFENRGNIAVHANKALVEDITPLINQSFSIVSNISKERDVQPLTFDTLTLTFSPLVEGESFARVVLQTDIQSRVSGVPESVANPSVIVRAFATRAKLQFLQSTIQYDSLPVFEECYSEKERTISVRNQGNAQLRVTSIVVQPPQAPFKVLQAPFDLEQNQSQSFTVVFSPQAVGIYSAQLLVFTSDSDQPYSLPLNGKGIPAERTDIIIPSSLSYYPGHSIQIPIRCSASALSVTNKFRASLQFDSSMLRYRSYTSINTASSAAIIDVTEQPRGQLRCNVIMPNGSRFRALDTLILLQFDTYLGYNIESELLLNNPELGTDNCTSALPLRVQNGLIRIDSLCGLQYKIPNRRVAFSSSVMSQNDELHINTSLPFAIPIHYRIINALGEVVAEFSKVQTGEGGNTSVVPTSQLSGGIYYLEIRADILKGMAQFAITR